MEGEESQQLGWALNSQTLLEFVPLVVTLALVIAVLFVANRVVRRNPKGEISVGRQAFMLALTAVCVLLVIFSLPITETSRGQLLSVIGLVVTGVIALSSTTFVANIMAGLMLRAVDSFSPGDFLHCQEYFGRVTERGLFHVEIQTQDRDLATVPNLFLVNNPVTVVHESGTIISADLSLGYDVSHVLVEELLKEAVVETGLSDSFVLVGDLNDFSVSYRVGGFSDDVSRLLTTKSNLRKNILHVMHANGIEIVSPNYMNQRVLTPGARTLPQRHREKQNAETAATPEDVIFDKADSAAEREALKSDLADARAALEDLLAEWKANPDRREAVDREKLLLERRIEFLTERLAVARKDD